MTITTGSALPFSLKGRVAVVTGGGRGIGRDIARVFAQAGALVIVATRTAGPGEETVRMIEEAGGQARLIVADLGDRAQAFSLIDETARACGRIDIVVHNAGVFPFVTVDDLSEADLENSLNVNLKAAFWLAKAAAPHLRASPAPRLLFTSSLSGNRFSAPTMVHYGATKSGLNGFIRGAALEYGPDRITVNGVEPGAILTEAFEQAAGPEQTANVATAVPLGRLGNGEDIAYAMLYLASDQANYVTGQTIVVDGGLSVKVPV